MIVAVASGKGGTGKTTVATNIALLLGEQRTAVRYLDCDVEEPNGHLFLKPELGESRSATIPVPVIDLDKCTACGECVRFCEYRALIRLGTQVMVFPELCHGCGGCTRVCPQKAIHEQAREIGRVEIGTSGAVGFVHGRLNVGEAMSPPLIRDVLSETMPETVNIVDAPPGTSCPAIASLRQADFVILVTEPSPFGLNDLGLALDTVRQLGVPHGVVVNRAEAGNADAQEFCAVRNATVLAQIPDERRIAEAYSRGEMILRTVPGVRERLGGLWQTVHRQVRI